MTRTLLPRVRATYEPTLIKRFKVTWKPGFDTLDIDWRWPWRRP